MNTLAKDSSESHTSMSDENEKADRVYLLNLHQYLHKEIYVRVDQFTDPR